MFIVLACSCVRGIVLLFSLLPLSSLTSNVIDVIISSRLAKF